MGRARRAFDLSLSYAATRKQFGQPIGRFQGVSFKLADMVTEIDAADWLTPSMSKNGRLSAAALSLGRSTRWLLMHHVGHRGYDRVPGMSSDRTSKGFARGRRRFAQRRHDVVEAHHLRRREQRPERTATREYFEASAQWHVVDVAAHPGVPVAWPLADIGRRAVRPPLGGVMGLVHVAARMRTRAGRLRHVSRVTLGDRLEQTEHEARDDQASKLDPIYAMRQE